MRTKGRPKSRNVHDRRNGMGIAEGFSIVAGHFSSPSAGTKVGAWGTPTGPSQSRLNADIARNNSGGSSRGAVKATATRRKIRKAR
jgi:hypothetical protein